jgi:pimeloyl-ACP methyl ester carboxylesterase
MEHRGIFAEEGGYKPAYAALSMRVLGPYMYVKPPPRTYKPPPIATDIVREMWSGRSDYRIHGNLKGFDFTRQLQRVSAPVLIIVGDHDMVSPASAELTRRSCRRATLVVMAASAHMMFLDQTEQFRELLALFVRRCASEASRRGRG